MKIDEIKALLKEREISAYDRSNYDEYITSSNFAFNVKSIHITGTNGKGSTAKYLEQIYLANGYKVGLFHSPYLLDVTEMINVNGEQITDLEFEELFNELYREFDKYNLTGFEMETIIAYTYFLRKGIDIAIIEVGMGGFIDATNIITPILSIITSVSLEHTLYLGRSVSEIADSKAGIIKHEVPALIGKLDDENALYAIRERCKKMESHLYVVDDYHNERIEEDHVVFDYYPYVDLKLHTKALYQCKNASIALEAIKILKDVTPIDIEKTKEALYSYNLPCRFEYVKDNIIIDGAHNVEAIDSLTQTIVKVESRPIHVLLATFRDKNLDGMLSILGKEVASILLTTFNHKRARTEDEYFIYLGDYEFREDYKAALKELEEKYPEDVILVTGSLAFSGVVRDYLLKGEK